MALAVGAVTAPPAEGAPSARRICPDVPGADLVGATNVRCAEAHKLIRMWLAGVRRDGRYDRRVAGWTCRNRKDPYEGPLMVCRKGSKSVRWYVNIPSRR